VAETDAFRQVVRAAFQGRRKTLRNALATVGGRERAELALARAGIAPELRGETLSVAEFGRLAAAFEQLEAGA
jgi:16S rRNA (adenine1518-N6/adenine1519-N6)-dimethyltransferase